MDAERAIELSPQGAGLIIVDMQAEGCERHGAGVKPVIRNIRALLERFRQANGKIIHVQSVKRRIIPNSPSSVKSTHSSMTVQRWSLSRSLNPMLTNRSSKSILTTASIKRPWKSS